MDKYRFPEKLMQSVIALGAVVLLFSIYELKVSALGIPFLILTLIAMRTVKATGPHVGGGRFPIPLVQTFAFLAALLFDGEAAILLATFATICASIRYRRPPIVVLFYSATTTLFTAIVVWSLRYTAGDLTAIPNDFFSFTFIQVLFGAALIQAGLYGTFTIIGDAYKIKHSVLKVLSGIYGWMFCLHFGSVIAAVIVAGLVKGFGLTVSTYSALGLSVAGLLFQSYINVFDSDDVGIERTGVPVRDNSEKFRSAFDHAAIGMALVSSEGRWLQVNRSLCSILGYPESELIQTDFLSVTHPDDLGQALANIKDLLKGRVATHQMEKRYVHKQGHIVWVTWSVSLARDLHTHTPHLIFQVQDITDRKRAEERLMHDAFHDALTSLPNRALFMDHLKLAIARGLRKPDHLFAVLYLDLDRFKIVNDSLGHMIGDQLLVGIAKRLEFCLRPGDTIARLGGDEFTILLEDVKDEEDVSMIAYRIQNELKQPFVLGGRDVFTTVSIGIALSSTEYSKPEEILRDADTAMYRAKTLGKARHEIFDKAMHAHALNVLQIETDLRRAVERQEFFIEYQPIVSLANGKLRGFEALVRWRHPERGFVSPADFIPIAEETGLINPIGSWVLKESCLTMRRWQSLYPVEPDLFMSVNLSGKQFAQQNLIGEVAGILRDSGLRPDTLKLEITESVVMDNIETATEMLQQLRALGLKLSIDDFGTGYSSLSYLHRFPIDTLKIDRSFVTQMSENNENAEIVRTIIMLAKNLGMDVVAEGVETTEQCEQLNGLSCQHGQGYYFSRAVAAEKAEQFVMDTYAGMSLRESAHLLTVKATRAA